MSLRALGRPGIGALATGQTPVSFRRVQVGSLPAVQADELYGSMLDVASDSAGVGSNDVEWIRRSWPSRRSEFDRASCYLAYSAGLLVGFMWASRKRAGRFHLVQLQAAYVRRRFQGCGVGFGLNARMFLREVLAAPGLRTFLVADMVSPVAFHGWRSRAQLAESFFPVLSADGTSLRSSPLSDVAEVATSEIYGSGGILSTAAVLKGRTLPRSGEVRPSGKVDVDRYFREHVSAELGDACLVVMNPSIHELSRNLRNIFGAVCGVAASSRERGGVR